MHNLSLKSLTLGAGTWLASTATFANETATGVVHTAKDLAFNTPLPPNELYPQNAEHVFVSTAIMAAIASVVMIIAARDSWKYRSTVPLGMVLGAAFCVVPESIDNYLGGVFWTYGNNPDHLMFVLMGRNFEWYVSIMWWAFGAILGYILYASLLRQVKTRTLWLVLIVSGLSDILVEELLLGYGGIYTYYGNQPLVLINHFPWWWLFVNVSALFMSAAIAYRFRHWFNGWKSVLILLLMPFCYIGGFSFTGMPAVFAVNGSFTPLVTQLLGIVTCVVSVIFAGATMYIVLGRNPFKFKQGITNDLTMASPNKSANKVRN